MTQSIGSVSAPWHNDIKAQKGKANVASMLAQDEQDLFDQLQCRYAGSIVCIHVDVIASAIFFGILREIRIDKFNVFGKWRNIDK